MVASRCAPLVAALAAVVAVSAARALSVCESRARLRLWRNPGRRELSRPRVSLERPLVIPAGRLVGLWDQKIGRGLEGVVTCAARL